MSAYAKKTKYKVLLVQLKKFGKKFEWTPFSLFYHRPSNNTVKIFLSVITTLTKNDHT